MTEWRSIPDVPDYEVSDDGQVRRQRASALRNNLWQMGKPLHIEVNKRSGHCRVALRIDGVLRRFYVHRLVAAAFIGPCPDGLVVNHLDSDPGNNRQRNLEYVTLAENIRYGFAQGHYDHHIATMVRPKGEQHHGAKLTDNAVRDMREAFETGESQTALAHKYGVRQATVWRIVRRLSWQHIP